MGLGLDLDFGLLVHDLAGYKALMDGIMRYDISLDGIRIFS